MIHFKKGDIFSSLDNPEVGILVNPVNTMGVMGAGLALTFRELFPSNYQLYREVCKAKKMEPGNVLITEDTWRGRKILIANMATKGHWKNPSKLIWIQIGLLNLHKEATKEDCDIAMPWVGCGLGGLKKEIVKKEILSEFNNFPNNLFVYEI